MRTAIVKNEDVNRVAAYLPQGYEAEQVGDDVVIRGEDHAGWTLDGYVIPRLMSGLIVAKEVRS